jgi:7-keto-8-aminopelargonate synthetase-like enzyme
VMVAAPAKGFAAGCAALVFPDLETARLVRTCGSTMIFSGPLQPALLGAAIASARFHLSSELAERQAQLLARVRLFNQLAAERHLPLGAADAAPIRFVRMGDNETTFRVAAALMRDGFYVNGAVFPAVTRGQGGLRVALTTHQTTDDVRALIEAIAAQI